MNCAVSAWPGAGTVTIHSSESPNGASIAIDDEGPEFPSEDLERIFQPFYTTRLEEGGTGLGLAVVQGIVNAHGGEIHAANRVKGGARIEITLALEE